MLARTPKTSPHEYPGHPKNTFPKYKPRGRGTAWTIRTSFSQRSTQRTRQRILEEACTPNRYDSRTQARTATTRRNKAQASVQEVHFRPEVLPTSAFWHTVQARNKKSNYDCLMQPRTRTAHHGSAQGLLAHLKGTRRLVGALTMVLRSEACCHRTRGKVIPRRPAPVEPTSATIKSSNATAEEVHAEEPANTTARKKPSISRATTRPGSHSHLPKDREPRDDRTFCIRPVQRQGRGEDSKRELLHRVPPEQAAPAAADLGHWERPRRHMLA